ncbi:MAG: tRNA (guanosine(37)-N1)-methyltransferase TrmD [Patescibacteria group bacterium]
MKQFDVITIFPHILDSYVNESLFSRAQKNKLIKINFHYLRKWTKDKHQTVDDKPYGGGVGLVFKADIIMKALKTIINKPPPFNKGEVGGGSKKTRIILTAANGKKFTQNDAKRLAKYDQLIFICPRYEGVDARVEKIVDEKISIGDYVLTGGELPAMVIMDAVSRYYPTFVGKQESVQDESFSSEGYLEYPQYTRPEVIKYKNKNWRVPKVLLSGHHGEIRKWRQKKAKNVK